MTSPRLSNFKELKQGQGVVIQNALPHTLLMVTLL